MSESKYKKRKYTIKKKQRGLLSGGSDTPHNNSPPPAKKPRVVAPPDSSPPHPPPSPAPDDTTAATDGESSPTPPAKRPAEELSSDADEQPAKKTRILEPEIPDGYKNEPFHLLVVDEVHDKTRLHTNKVAKNYTLTAQPEDSEFEKYFDSNPGLAKLDNLQVAWMPPETCDAFKKMFLHDINGGGGLEKLLNLEIYIFDNNHTEDNRQNLVKFLKNDDENIWHIIDAWCPWSEMKYVNGESVLIDSATLNGRTPVKIKQPGNKYIATTWSPELSKEYIEKGGINPVNNQIIFNEIAELDTGKYAPSNKFTVFWQKLCKNIKKLYCENNAETVVADTKREIGYYIKAIEWLEKNVKNFKVEPDKPGLFCTIGEDVKKDDENKEFFQFQVSQTSLVNTMGDKCDSIPRSENEGKSKFLEKLHEHMEKDKELHEDNKTKCAILRLLKFMGDESHNYLCWLIKNKQYSPGSTDLESSPKTTKPILSSEDRLGILRAIMIYDIPVLMEHLNVIKNKKVSHGFGDRLVEQGVIKKNDADDKKKFDIGKFFAYYNPNIETAAEKADRINKLNKKFEEARDWFRDDGTIEATLIETLDAYAKEGTTDYLLNFTKKNIEILKRQIEYTKPCESKSNNVDKALWAKIMINNFFGNEERENLNNGSKQVRARYIAQQNEAKKILEYLESIQDKIINNVEKKNFDVNSNQSIKKRVIEFYEINNEVNDIGSILKGAELIQKFNLVFEEISPPSTRSSSRSTAAASAAAQTTNNNPILNILIPINNFKTPNNTNNTDNEGISAHSNNYNELSKTLENIQNLLSIYFPDNPTGKDSNHEMTGGMNGDAAMRPTKKRRLPAAEEPAAEEPADPEYQIFLEWWNAEAKSVDTVREYYYDTLTKFTFIGTPASLAHYAAFYKTYYTEVDKTEFDEAKLEAFLGKLETDINEDGDWKDINDNLQILYDLDITSYNGIIGDINMLYDFKNRYNKKPFNLHEFQQNYVANIKTKLENDIEREEKEAAAAGNGDDAVSKTKAAASPAPTDAQIAAAKQWRKVCMESVSFAAEKAKRARNGDGAVPKTPAEAASVSFAAGEDTGAEATAARAAVALPPGDGVAGETAEVGIKRSASLPSTPRRAKHARHANAPPPPGPTAARISRKRTAAASRPSTPIAAASRPSMPIAAAKYAKRGGGKSTRKRKTKSKPKKTRRRKSRKSKKNKGKSVKKATLKRKTKRKPKKTRRRKSNKN